MAYVGNKVARPSLLIALDDPHWRVRMMAIQALGRLGIDHATTQLIFALNDEHERVRSAAALALASVGNTDALQPLTRQLAAGNESHRTQDAIVEILEHSAHRCENARAGALPVAKPHSAGR